MKMLKIFKAAKAAGQSALHDLDPRNGLAEEFEVLLELIILSAERFLLQLKVSYLSLQCLYLFFRRGELLAEYRIQRKLAQKFKEEAHALNSSPAGARGKAIRKDLERAGIKLVNKPEEVPA